MDRSFAGLLQHYDVRTSARTENPMRIGYLPLILFLILLALLPLVFRQLFTTALMKLRLEPFTAILLIIGIIVGGGINIPIKRIARNEALVEDPLAILGLTGRWPWFQRVRHKTVIAVNVGGCLVPADLAIMRLPISCSTVRKPSPGLPSRSQSIRPFATDLHSRSQGLVLPCRDWYLPGLQP